MLTNCFSSFFCCNMKDGKTGGHKSASLSLMIGSSNQNYLDTAWMMEKPFPLNFINSLASRKSDLKKEKRVYLLVTD